jgi:hypothetical protein
VLKYSFLHLWGVWLSIDDIRGISEIDDIRGISEDEKMRRLTKFTMMLISISGISFIASLELVMYNFLIPLSKWLYIPFLLDCLFISFAVFYYLMYPYLKNQRELLDLIDENELKRKMLKKHFQDMLDGAQVEPDSMIYEKSEQFKRLWRNIHRYAVPPLDEQEISCMICHKKRKYHDIAVLPCEINEGMTMNIKHCAKDWDCIQGAAVLCNEKCHRA